MTTALDLDETIVAISSAPEPASRGIVRLSGSKAWDVALTGFLEATGPDRRPPMRPEIVRGNFRIPGLRPPLPAMIALWPAPRTYTGQPLAEIHTVGSPPILSLLVGHCLRSGARPAGPGEFTLRAFLSGRIDLTAAEAVLGVIESRNSDQLDAALRQLAGGLSGPIRTLRDRLLDVVAHLEANLDFSDEPDVDPLGRSILAGELEQSASTLADLADRLAGRDLRDQRPRVVLVGPPNAGKSLLFNALLGQGRALVSPRAGTTRDYLTAVCDCGGIVVELVDTAGIDEPGDRVEHQAQAMRADQCRSADLLLRCLSADTAGEARSVWDESNSGCTTLDVWTKCDLRPRPAVLSTSAVDTCAARGEGISALRLAIVAALRSQEAVGEAMVAGTAARCRDSLIGAAEAIAAASATIVTSGGDELVAADLRLAIDELGKVVGVTVTDDILDRIFRRFCIGK